MYSAVLSAVANITQIFKLCAKKLEKFFTFALDNKKLATMGKFLDYGNLDFTSVRKSDFVDKAG
ncbi:MAG: hypothetical protein J6U21_17280 [Bacteroidales bacterium]|nr:hypothetical protein [Bacteroidales bacterium]